MPAEPQRFREVMGHLPTGVAVVTSAGPDGPAGLTTNAMTSVSLEPTLLLVCFDNTSRTLPAVIASRRFVVNVLREGQDELAHRFASKAPMTEKFAGVAHTLPDGMPVLDDALAWLHCEVRELLAGGDHTVVLGEVVELDADPSGRPLVYHRGAYTGLQGGPAG